MRHVDKSIAWMALIALAAARLAADEQPNPQAKLETAIPEAIRLLSANEFLPFLHRFASPDDQKKIGIIVGGDGPSEEAARLFGEKKAPRLLATLKAIGDTEPSLNEDGTLATYEVPKPVGPGKQSIRFIKVGKLWYLKN